MSRLILPIGIKGCWEMIRKPLSEIAILSETGASVEFTLAEVEMVLAPLAERMGARKLEWSMAVGEFFSAITGPHRDLYFDLDGARQRIDIAWLRLVLQTNADLPLAAKDFEQGNDPGLLDSFPAQELLASSSTAQMDEWRGQWGALGGNLFDGRMIALRSDPIWVSINRLGHCHEPFDFDWSVVAEEIGRDEAEEFGLLNRDTKVEPVHCAACDEP